MWLVYLTLMPIFREGSGQETMRTYNGMMDVHKCFGPCSGSCLQVQIYCSTILLPNTFTFISPDARSITLHKDDDTVQRQQFMLPLSQCTKLNHHHFLLLTKVRNIVSMTNTSLMTILPVLEVLLMKHSLSWDLSQSSLKHSSTQDEKLHGCYLSRVSTSLVWNC